MLAFRLFPVAIRNLTRNHRRSTFTLAAVVIGVAMLIFLDAVNRSISSTLMNGVIHAQFADISIFKKGYQAMAKPTRLLHLNIPYTEDILTKVRAIKEVEAVSGRILFQAILSGNNAQAHIIATGIDPEHEQEVCPYIRMNLQPGTHPLSKDDAIGSGIINIDLGRTLSTLDKQPIILQGVSQDGRNNSIDINILGFSPTIFGLKTNYITLNAAQMILDMDGRVTELAVKIKDGADSFKVTSALQASLGQDYEVYPWQFLIPEVADADRRQKSMLWVVSALLAILVIFGIANTMLMCVRERTREIGTMTALGMRPIDVLVIFVEEAFVIGVIGGVIGGIVGILLSIGANRIGISVGSSSPIFSEGLRPTFNLLYAFFTVLGAIFAAIIAGLVPAWKAARKNPIDAMSSHH